MVSPFGGMRKVQKGNNPLCGIKQQSSFDHLLERRSAKEDNHGCCKVMLGWSCGLKLEFITSNLGLTSAWAYYKKDQIKDICND